jgi:hypothetical protein
MDLDCEPSIQTVRTQASTVMPYLGSESDVAPHSETDLFELSDEVSDDELHEDVLTEVTTKFIRYNRNQSIAQSVGSVSTCIMTPHEHTPAATRVRGTRKVSQVSVSEGSD